MKKDKIIWPADWSTVDSPFFCYSVDGVHFWINELLHPTMSKNPKLASHKNKKPSLDYEVALSLWESKVVHLNGPHVASKHDITVFREKLKGKTPRGKKGIADLGYRGEKRILSTPNSHDPEELRTFKSRARARQESFNARIEFFGCLSQRFRHGVKKHEICFEAVCVILQYQMENGSPLFDI